MGAGRPPKPTALKVLAGTLKKCRTNNAEPVFPSPKDITCPFDEKKESVAAAHWNELAPDLIRLGLLTVTSKATLVDLCRVRADIVACEEKIAAEGRWVMVPVFSRKTGEVTGEVEKENIAVKRLVALRYQHEKLLNEFGGNPSSAAKVASQKKPESKVPSSFASKFLAPVPKA
jgi:phage terminase small subunit